MTRTWLAIGIALLATGCGDKQSPEDRARSDASDVAEIEAAQDRHPPLQPITPEPITKEDVQRRGLSGAGCSFVPEGAQDGRPLLVTLQQKAVFKLDGKLLVLAANPASAELPNGAREHYDGRTHALRLRADGEGGTAFLTITDQFERPVFVTQGVLDCAA